MIKTATILALLSLQLGTTTLLQAADEKKKGGAAAATGGNVDKKDAKFATEAAVGGLYEVQAGELAQKKGSASKQLGAEMIKDHSKANEELKQLASSKGITLPTTLDAKHAGKIEKLSKLEGAEFDKAYLDEMQKDHKKDISLFEDASKNATDPDLKAFATKTLPVLRKHLEHVQHTHSAATGAGGSGEANKGSGSGSGAAGSKTNP
jgi:putative membrane protein